MKCLSPISPRPPSNFVVYLSHFKNLSQNFFVSQKILGRKYVGKKNVAYKFLVAKKMLSKKFSSKKIVGPKNVPWTNVASPKKIVCPKEMGLKNVGSKKNWIYKILVEKNFRFTDNGQVCHEVGS